MGNDHSAAQLRPQVDDMEFKTPFNRAELKKLARNFHHATHGTYEMTPEMFRTFLGLTPKQNTLVGKIFEDVDTSGDQVIGFDEFVFAHAKLGRGSLRDKLLYCFDLFDADGDGVLSKTEGVAMIKCMSASFANYILSIYGNSNDPRSAASVAAKQQKAAKGKALLGAALNDKKSRDETLETLFSTADKSRDGALDRTEFVAFLGQFPRCFDILNRFFVKPIAEAPAQQILSAAGAGAAYATY